MKITNVKVDMFDWIAEPWKTGVGTRFGEGHQLGVVTVETDEGITGNAFLGSSRMGADHFAPGLIQFIKPIIMGRNPQDIGSIWWELWKMNRSVSTYVIGAIDICLWDINGKIAGQPIHRLLGTCKDSVPVYSSTAYHETKEEYAEEAIRFKDMGWTAHKIHPHGNPEYDIEISRTVREAVGDQMKLMLDSMWSYQYEDALRVGRAIEDLNFYWYEDPLRDGGTSHNAYKLLREKIKTPLLQGEHLHLVEAHVDMAIANATDIFRADPEYDGGITGVMKIAHAAEAMGMDVELHPAGPAQRHCMAAIRNTNFYEMAMIHPKLPHNSSSPPLYLCDYSDELKSVDKNGNVLVPNGPGLGVLYDWKTIE